MRVLAIAIAIAIATAGCTSSGGGPSEDDRDGDGLRDTIETTPRGITLELANGTHTRLVTSDPTVQDTDGDGLMDVDEFLRGSDPRDVDSDGDGLLDGDSIMPTHSPTLTEWRRRAIVESPTGTFLGELSLCSERGGLKPTAWSSDLPLPDGLSDAEEISGWDMTLRGQARRVVSSSCLQDTDSDGLPDHEEKTLGGDPRAPDTDGDGVKDGIDADVGWDLGIAISNLTGSLSNGSRVRLAFSLGPAFEDVVVPPPWHEIPVALTDATADRSSLLAIGSLAALDDEGRPLDLMPTGSRVDLRFDLAAGTLDVAGALTQPGPVQLTGADGSASFEWRVTRD